MLAALLAPPAAVIAVPASASAQMSATGVDEARALEDAKSSSVYVRSAAARSLARLHASKNPRVLAALLKLATDSDQSVRRDALRGLPSFQKSEATRALVKASGDADAGVRITAQLALGRVTGRAARQVLLLSVHSANARVRQSVAYALKAFPDKEVERTLYAMLRRDKDPLVVAAAASSLGTLATPGAVEGLIKVAESHKDPATRKAAIRALGRTKHSSASPPLHRLLEGSDAAIAAAAATALGQLGHADNIPKLVWAVQHSDRVVRAEAIYALGQLRAVRQRDVFLAALADPDAWVRTSAANGLERLGPAVKDARVVAALARALSTETSSELRRSAARALGAIGATEATSVLIATLRDSQYGVVAAAADALGTLKVSSATSALAPLVKHSSAIVSNSAMSALRRITGKPYYTRQQWIAWSNGGDDSVKDLTGGGVASPQATPPQATPASSAPKSCTTDLQCAIGQVCNRGACADMQ